MNVCGCDLNAGICRHILDYLCSYESEWWQGSPTIGALDTTDRLGLSRLLQFIVKPYIRESWEETKFRLEGLVVETKRLWLTIVDITRRGFCCVKLLEFRIT